MEYREFDKLRDVADVRVAARPVLTRRERLERWATLLEQDPARRLRSLGEIETKTAAERVQMRSPDSPLTVAFEDKILRADGLASDRLGDAIDYFEMTDDDAHRLLCSCMNGWTMSAGKVARGVRNLANPDTRLQSAAWVVAGAFLVTPVLMLFFG
ncbi:hypothetical protein GCM10007036_12020 [Alsobacter metallidurans]|uniref:Uncharacterized protein n=1 Tax=Alsobacter metallidurans TaxID=340221 RepID=A0A917I5L7_9HYPH|nr:hypothetical protein [Alsobacter metallidurans]GGH13434.1 hypothetical protein GCM10007036_12020 [Alsobacter metallidurans]